MHNSHPDASCLPTPYKAGLYSWQCYLYNHFFICLTLSFQTIRIKDYLGQALFYPYESDMSAWDILANDLLFCWNS